MHPTLKSVEFPFEKALPQCFSIIRYHDTNVRKGDCKNNCFEKNMFESNAPL